MAKVNFNASTNGKPEPGKTMGILSLVGAFLLPPAGLVCGIIGLKQSKEVKKDNPLALAGTIISGVTILISIIVTIIAFSIWGATANKVMQLGEGIMDEAQQSMQQAKDSMAESRRQSQQDADQRQQILEQAQQAIDEANQQIQSTPDTTQQMQDAEAAAQRLLQQMQQ